MDIDPDYVLGLQRENDALRDDMETLLRVADTCISQAESARFRNEVGRLGDRYLALAYLELPTAFQASIYADMLEREMIDRFCEQNAMIPEMAVAED